MTLHFTLQSLDQAAQTFIEQALPPLATLKAPQILAFYAELGAGKTTFIRTLCRRLGTTDAPQSPTFNIINQYALPKPLPPLYHIDLYRLTHITQAYDIGLPELLETTALFLIEWPQIIEPLLPSGTIRIQITQNPDLSRTLHTSLQ